MHDPTGKSRTSKLEKIDVAVLHNKMQKEELLPYEISSGVLISMVTNKANHEQCKLQNIYLPTSLMTCPSTESSTKGSGIGRKVVNFPYSGNSS